MANGRPGRRVTNANRIEHYRNQANEGFHRLDELVRNHHRDNLTMIEIHAGLERVKALQAELQLLDHKREQAAIAREYWSLPWWKRLFLRRPSA